MRPGSGTVKLVFNIYIDVLLDASCRYSKSIAENNVKCCYNINRQAALNYFCSTVLLEMTINWTWISYQQTDGWFQLLYISIKNNRKLIKLIFNLFFLVGRPIGIIRASVHSFRHETEIENYHVILICKWNASLYDNVNLTNLHRALVASYLKSAMISHSET